MSGPFVSVPLKQPPGVLGKIVARKIADLRKTTTLHLPAPSAPRLRRDFKAALRGGRHLGARLIAEIKPRSPSQGTLVAGANIDQMRQRAAGYAQHAAAVSVLCDQPFFGGSLQLLTQIAETVDCPVLCKDFIVSEQQLESAAAHGADAVLLMVSLLPQPSLCQLLQSAQRHGMAALVEVHDERELTQAVDADASIIGVNSRDLTTLTIDLQRGLRLLEQVPTDRIKVAESGIETADDVRCLHGVADAALVGTALMRADNVDAKIHAMGFARCA